MDDHRIRTMVPRLSIPKEDEKEEEEEDVKEKTSTPITSAFRSSSSTQFSLLSKRKRKSLSTSRATTTRFYRYIELEEAMMSSDLLDKYVDRHQFHRHYIEAIRDNRVDQYLEKCYDQLDERKKFIEEEKRQKHLRTFTFVDLEERFLSQDPTRDMHIVFVEDPTGLKAIRSTTLMYKQYEMKHHQEKEYSIDVDSFYRNECDRMVCSSPRARDQITLFAREAAENLQQYLPHLPRVPHRVTIVDQRDQISTMKNFDERQIQMEQHRTNLDRIHQRRRLLSKMIEQSKVNQINMKQSLDQIWKRDQRIHQK